MTQLFEDIQVDTPTAKIPTKECNVNKVKPCQGHAQHSWVLGEEVTEVKQEYSGCCGECC